MRCEKEFMWIIRLLNSPYVKGFFKKKVGCKKDFERTVCSPERNKEFNIWLNELIEEGSLEKSNEMAFGLRGNVKVQGYVINSKVLIKRLNKNKMYQDSLKYFKKVLYGGG